MSVRDITGLAGTLRYDLVRANALKMVCVCAYTTLVLGVFIAQGLVIVRSPAILLDR